ncbi:hypothetical protein IDJ75_08685 [Mucilaginibacter rigui]|uniref:Lipoprotein n=1 Tax=Mucilaginibacter rigui TaxID=534635 RepID=A0ABR7X6Y2_9SPHI|nr:hypothetical protein [Mucilaginibacter rigui]MBD1385350.1 hypothetical protein [Mucilaginibacter rigui]
MNKVTFLFVAVLALFLYGCSSNQKPQFGKAPLHLDNFGLNLDVETFFGDESLFRNNEKYSVRSEEETIQIDGSDSTLRYVQYTVSSSHVGDTLARFNGFYFGDLNVVMDFDDKETFMVAASQENVRPGKLDTLIKEISAEYGSVLPNDKNNEPRYITYQWKKDNKLAKLVLNVESPLYSGNDTEQTPNTNKLYADAYHKADNVSVTFFITNPKFDHYLVKARSTSGLLTRY